MQEWRWIQNYKKKRFTSKGLFLASAERFVKMDNVMSVEMGGGREVLITVVRMLLALTALASVGCLATVYATKIIMQQE